MSASSSASSSAIASTTVRPVEQYYVRINAKTQAHKPVRAKRTKRALEKGPEMLLSVASSVVKPESQRARITVLQKAFSLYQRAQKARERRLYGKFSWLMPHTAVGPLVNDTGFCMGVCLLCDARYKRLTVIEPMQCDRCAAQAHSDLATFENTKMRDRERAIYPLYKWLRSFLFPRHGAFGAFTARYTHADSYLNLLPEDVFVEVMKFATSLNTNTSK